MFLSTTKMILKQSKAEIVLGTFCRIRIEVVATNKNPALNIEIEEWLVVPNLK